MNTGKIYQIRPNPDGTVSVCINGGKCIGGAPVQVELLEKDLPMAIKTGLSCIVVGDFIMIYWNGACSPIDIIGEPHPVDF